MDKVHLRKRKQTKGGKISLYLEIYKGTTTSADGKIVPIRKYEYLDMFLIDKPKTPFDKRYNEETFDLAKNIQSKRILEIGAGTYNLPIKKSNKVNFIVYFQNHVNSYKQNKKLHEQWDSVLKQLIKFESERINFAQIDTEFCKNFKAYLLNDAFTKHKNKLSNNSSRNYFQKFKSLITKAYEDGLMQSNPAKTISPPKEIQSIKEYLTLDELKKLVNTDCKNDFLKRAFLFSCLSGLRWGDVMQLKWADLKRNNNSYRIIFKQQKTDNNQYLDISDQAAKYLGTPTDSKKPIFSELSYSSYLNLLLQKWIVKAGIPKDITFHSARHTHAVLVLENDVDIYTVSKRLGHSQVRTTEIYAKIINKKMTEAANVIPNINI